MEVEFHTVDVFTGRAYTGNPVAIVPDASDLTKAQMQAIAAEFGYSETAFLQPPQSRSGLARIRIFTPKREVPFGGQPSIGAAFILGRLGSVHGRGASMRMTLEADAGAITAELTRDGATLIGASVQSPQLLDIGPDVARELIARCAGLSASDILIQRHVPLVASVGVPFILAELRDVEVLERARLCTEVFAAHFPLSLAKGLHLYVNAGSGSSAAMNLIARTFAPLHGMDEDLATGSANAALAGLLMILTSREKRTLSFRTSVAQGGFTGRPSLIEALAERTAGAGEGVRTWVRGRCAPVMRGHLRVPEG